MFSTMRDDRPNSRTILVALEEAGDTGLTARDISQQFGMDDPQHALSETNLYLHRARAMGRVRRSQEKERTISPAGGNSRSYRWFITPSGVEYLVPKPLPAVTVLDEPPNTQRVMEILKEVGEEGMLGATIARHFTIPDPHMPSMEGLLNRSQNLQRRLAWTNQILDRFLLHSYVRRGPAEPSPYYHSVPCYRWFVTPEGVEYLAGGMGEGLRARRVAEAALVAAEQRERRVRRGELVTQAYQSYDSYTPNCKRNAAMRELREAGCTLAEIGGVFDVTRERARQILNGYRVGPCKCPRCIDERWFEVGDGVTA